MFKRNIFILSVLIFLLNCANDNKKANNLTQIKNPETIYLEGKNLLNERNIEQSTEKFKELIKLYPLSNEAIQAQIMVGFISYLKMDYETSISQFDSIILRYPAHKDLDYVYYMKGMCNFEQINNPGLDGKYNNLALYDFNQLIKRFPLSEYADDGRQKIKLIKSNQAAENMEIGRFYLKKGKYMSALNRFKIIVDEFSTTRFTPEALYRMVEIYYHLGMEEDSIKTASVLGHNYPQSKWYQYSYDLINEIENNDTLFKKVKNIFN